MDEGGFLKEFRRTTLFEQKIAEYTRAKNCIVTNNGRVFLAFACLVSGLKFGDEVIVSNYTMIATPNW